MNLLKRVIDAFRTTPVHITKFTDYKDSSCDSPEHMLSSSVIRLRQQVHHLDISNDELKSMLRDISLKEKAEKELRENTPGLNELWSKYQSMLILHKGQDDEK